VCWNDNKPFQAIYNIQGQREILNPISNFTYEFVNNLIKEFKETFQDQYIHLGMDEGNTKSL
jgi:N-acetyl-beta-hexosaminidase